MSLNAVFFHLILIVLPTGAGMFLFAGRAHAQDALEFQMRIDTFRCISVTEEPDMPALGKNDTDEVYFTVLGPGYRFARFPADDNFYLSKAGWNLEKKGWIDKSQNESENPVIWHGVCTEDEPVRIQILIWEQDLSENIGLEAMVQSAEQLALERLENDPQRITKLIKEKEDDTVGGFEVYIKKTGDKLAVHWGELDFTKVRTASDGLRSDFECKGPAGSIYRGSASIHIMNCLTHVQTVEVLASDTPWNEEKKVDLKAGTTYVIAPSTISRYDLGRMTSPWKDYLDWYAGVGVIDEHPQIPLEKLRLGGLTVLWRIKTEAEEKDEAFPMDPFKGLLEISCKQGGILFFCIVDRPGQYFDNTGSCKVNVYRID